MRDDKEKQALIDILSHPAGYGVQMAGLIRIRNLEDRTIAVYEEFYEDGIQLWREDIYEDVTEAVDAFLEIRHKNEYGLDYEEALWEKG